MPMHQVTIPNRIRALLALRGWTVAQLAEASRLPRATVALHLLGRVDLTGHPRGRGKGTRPPAEVYAEALGVDVETLTVPWTIETEVV